MIPRTTAPPHGADNSYNSTGNSCDRTTAPAHGRRSTGTPSSGTVTPVNTVFGFQRRSSGEWSTTSAGQRGRSGPRVTPSLPGAATTAAEQRSAPLVTSSTISASMNYRAEMNLLPPRSDAQISVPVNKKPSCGQKESPASELDSLPMPLKNGTNAQQADHVGLPLPPLAPDSDAGSVGGAPAAATRCAVPQAGRPVATTPMSAPTIATAEERYYTDERYASFRNLYQTPTAPTAPNTYTSAAPKATGIGVTPTVPKASRAAAQLAEDIATIERQYENLEVEAKRVASEQLSNKHQITALVAKAKKLEDRAARIEQKRKSLDKELREREER